MVLIRLFSGQRVGPAAELGRPSGLPAGAHHGGVPRRALRLWRRGRLLERAGDAAVDLQHQGESKSQLLGPNYANLCNFRATPGESIRVQRAW